MKVLVAGGAGFIGSKMKNIEIPIRLLIKYYPA